VIWYGYNNVSNYSKKGFWDAYTSYEEVHRQGQPFG